MTGRKCRRLLTVLLFLGVLTLGGCSASPLKLPVSASVQVFDSYEELCASIGYDMVRIDGGGYDPVAYTSIDGVIGQIEYVNGDADLILRTEPGDEGDITGVGQVTYGVSDVNGVDLHVGFFKDIQAAWFETGGYSYGLTATGMDSEAFKQMAEQLAHAITGG